LLAVAGCNQVFGLQPTRLVDAAYYDAKPAQCPAIGTVPTFSRTDIFYSPNCLSYFPAEAGVGLADCSPVLQGPPDSATLTPATVPSIYYVHPRPAPEGDRAIFAHVSSSTLRPDEIDLLTYNGQAWGNPTKMPIDATAVDDVGAPSRSTGGAHVVATAANGTMFLEYVASGGTWTQLPAILPTALGLAGSSYVGDASLTPDGRRMVFFCQQTQGELAALYYADRASIGDAFGMASKIAVDAVVGAIDHPYLSEDCGRLYFTDSSTIFVATQ
jgi:hypothetical protein